MSVTETDVGELLFLADRASPYATYDEIRRRGLTRSTYGMWVAADHATCVAILRDHRFGSDARKSPAYVRPEPNYFAEGREVPLGHHTLLGLDPPDHTRLRRLVSQAFTPRAIAELRGYIEQVTAELIADVLDAGDVDLIDALAFPLPLAVICRILGVPAGDRHLFRAWGEDLVPTLDPFQTPEIVAKGRKADAELNAYLDGLISERRAAPSDDLLSRMIAAEEEGDRLTTDELLGTASLILGAGFETTVNLIGNGLLALLHNPDELERLRADPQLWPNAVNELLRFDSPVQLTARAAWEPVTVGDVEFAAGDDVLLLLGGANRDPAVFADPNSVDVGRANADEHLSFSSGAHHCLGAALARVESEVALAALVGATSSIELIDEPVYRPFMVLHGLASLRVRLTP